MNTITKRIEIDLYSPTSYEIIYAQQGDNLTRIIEFALYNQGKPYTIPEEGHEILAVMEGRRGDHSSFMKDCPVKDNLITATLDSGILYVPGTIQAKIFLYDAETNAILSTIPFQISVQEDPCDKNKIETEKSSAIDWLILQLHKLKTGFGSHLKDAVSHITASERTAWNDAYEKRHTHSNKTILDNTTASYTREAKNKLDGIQSGAEVNLPTDWKNSVQTYEQIASAYPNPQDGWTVNVKDTDYTYRYNGTDWIAISANAIPKATSSADGLFSKEDYGRFELLCSESISIQQPYAVCSEAMGTTAKTISIPKFILTTGAKATVKFPNGNSAGTPTLNVSGTGAKEIYYNGAPVSKNFIKRESVHDFVYDGSHWLLEGEKGAGYHHVTCSTEADNSAKSVTLAGFRLVNGTQLILQFTHGNTAENPTLNVQNTGAYPIYYAGMPIPPGYITENSAVQLVFDGQNRWVVVGDFLQQQLDDLKRFVHYKEPYWERVPVSVGYGSLIATRGLDSLCEIGVRGITNIDEIGTIGSVEIDISPKYSSDSTRFKVVTHVKQNGSHIIYPQPSKTTLSIKTVLAVSGSSTLMYSYDTTFIYDSSEHDIAANRLIINTWGSDLGIEVYKEVYKIW